MEIEKDNNGIQWIGSTDIEQCVEIEMLKNASPLKVELEDPIGLKCDYCPQQFTRKDNKKRHEQKVHVNPDVKQGPTFGDKIKQNYGGSINEACLFQRTEKMSERSTNIDVSNATSSSPSLITERNSVNLQHNTSDGKAYSCDKCSFATIHKNGLLSHLGNVHAPKAKPFKCKKCDYASAKNRNLWKHMRRVHGQVAKPKKPKCDKCQAAPCKCKVNFSCSQCPYTAKQKVHLDGHVARVHEGVKNFMCEECGTSFWRNSSLKKHVKDTHGEKSFVCDKCSYKTAHRRSLKYHIQYVHEGLKPYRCLYPDCQFIGTSIKTKLDEHLSVAHNHLYRCENCDYETHIRLDLIKHTKFTHLTCQECELTFDKKTHLTNHMIDLHPNVKPYACDLCTYATADELLLKRHVRLTHADTKKILSCSQCSFVTARQDSLTKHIKYIHEGKEKPYRCNYPNCSAETYTQAKLDTHIRRKHVEGRHHYKDERTLEWKQILNEANIPEESKENVDIWKFEEKEDLDILGDKIIEGNVEVSDEGKADTLNNIDPIGDDLAENDEHIVKELLDKDQSMILFQDCEDDIKEENDKPENENLDVDWIQSNSQPSLNKESPDNDRTVNPFKCNQCEYAGTKKRYLKKHMKKVHGDYVKTIKSPKGESSDKDEFRYKEENSVESVKSYTCDRCIYSTDERYLLARHMKNVHSEIKAFACDKCTFKTTYKYGLDKHVKVVHDNYKPHQCTYPNCSFKGTANKANLDIHIRAVHLKIKDHVCDICGYATVDKHTLLSHKKGVHDGIKDLICTMCGYVTAYPKALQRHIKIVHETKKLEPHEVVKDQICATCGFATHNQKNLKDHIKRRHESQEDKICAICGFTTNTQANLNAHMRRRHEDQFVEAVKTITCDMCTYVTNRRSCLRQHVKAAHDRIRDKVCTECGFETSYAGSLKNHINEVHANEKVNVKCNICSYSTNRTRNLKTHIMTVHYKIKPKPRTKTGKNPSQMNNTLLSSVTDVNLTDKTLQSITWEVTNV